MTIKLEDYTLAGILNGSLSRSKPAGQPTSTLEPQPRPDPAEYGRRLAEKQGLEHEAFLSGAREMAKVLGGDFDAPEHAERIKAQAAISAQSPQLRQHLDNMRAITGDGETPK